MAQPSLRPQGRAEVAVPFGYAIVGCGWVAEAHAWGARALVDDGVGLVAVADREIGRAQGLARDFDIQHVYSDYTELLKRDDVHAVSICLPDFLHAEATLAAAEAGKHILCEKPLALDLESADEMITACDRHGVALGFVMNHRYFPDNVRAKRAIAEGALGRLLLGSVFHSSCLTGNPSGLSPWRGRQGLAAGGILTTQAIHFLDLLLWFAGPVAAVKASTATLLRSDQDYEDTAVVSLRLESGALATVSTTNGAPIADDFTGTRLDVHGTEGFVQLEGDRLRLFSAHEGYELPDVQMPAPPAGSEDVPFGFGHIHAIADFVAAVRHGDPPPVSADDGRHLLAVLSAAYAASAGGVEVRIDKRVHAYSRPTNERSLLYRGAGS